MKRLRSILAADSMPVVLAIALVYLLILPPIHSQAPQAPVIPQVQQSTTHLDAATYVLSAATASATSTITPPSGQYVYVTGLDIENCANATNVTAAAQTAITTTNLYGAQWQISVGPLAGACTPAVAPVMQTTLKSAIAGGLVTFVMPAFGTNQTIRYNVYYYFGY